MKNTLFIVFFLMNASLYAQVDSLLVKPLDTVALNVTRLQKQPDRVPASFSRAIFRESAVNQQQLSLQEHLNQMNGVFTLNANNYAQDLRVSIRGFGARSAFGIRGIKLVVDGIPETTPDGQGQLDNLPLGIIDNIEVLRGASSALYGNASGGVINVNTISDFKKNFVTVGFTAGSYGMLQSQVTAGIKTEKSRYVLHGNQVTTDGYRDQSGFENYLFNYRSFHKVGDSTQLNLQLNYANSPVAEDAGGLDAETIAMDRRQARDRNILFETEESVQQVKIGSSLEHKSGNWTYNGYGFYSYRDFEARLPFENGGAIDLNRNYYGLGASATNKADYNTFTFTQRWGIDYGYQNDDRRRFLNEEGTRGAVTLNQNEIFSGLGVHYLQDLQFKKWTINVGLRYDFNTLKVEDNFDADGISNDKVNINEFSASTGVSYAINKAHQLFVSFSSSFETPVLSELSSDPENNGGFNQDLEAQTAQNFEIGYRGIFKSTRVETSVFYTLTEDDIVPFELEAFPDRTFFRNAGSSNRFGVELSVSQRLTKNLDAQLNYNLSAFEYDDYEVNGNDFSGNELPAIPQHLAQLQLIYTNQNLSLTLGSQYRGEMYTNDANSTIEEAVVIGQLRGSYKFSLSNIDLIPFLGINNLFDQEYSDNVRINAFGSRFFEPAPGINMYGGVRMTF